MQKIYQQEYPGKQITIFCYKNIFIAKTENLYNHYNKIRIACFNAKRNFASFVIPEIESSEARYNIGENDLSTINIVSKGNGDKGIGIKKTKQIKNISNKNLSINNYLK